MAIFRSRGGRSLTTRPPMRMSPPVCRSSPAIIRKSVVLPHPLGPSSTRNSPSRVCRSTPSTAVCSWKTFRMFLVSTVAKRAPRVKRGGDFYREVSPSRHSRAVQRRPIGGGRRRCAFPTCAAAAVFERLQKLALLPLGEDVPRLRLRFLDRVLGAHHALRRLGEHVVHDPLAVDVVDRRVGIPRVPDVGRPVERVG